MYCRKCGIQISDDSIFCYKCGDKVFILDSDKINNNTGENGSIENNKKSISENNNIKSDKTNTNITQNNGVENNAQKVNILKPDDVTKQNTEQQNINAPNIKPSLEPNKDGNKNKLNLLGVILIALAIIFAITNIIIYTSVINNSQQIKTFNDKETGISFTYPKTWNNNIFEEYKDDCIAYLISPGFHNQYSRMSVSKIDTKADKYTLNNLKYSMSKKSSNKDNGIEKVLDTKIDGVDAIKIINGEEDKRISIQYVYVINRDMYVITFISPVDNFDKNEPIFDSIMESYTITR